MQRRRSQLSLKVGFVLAVSILAFTMGEEERGRVKPHTIVHRINDMLNEDGSVWGK